MSKIRDYKPALPPLWVLTSLAVLIGIWLLYQLKEIVVLLVVGYSIAYLINPLLSDLEKKKISRGVGVFLIFGFAIIVITLLGLIAAPTFSREYEKLATNFPSYVDDAWAKLAPILNQGKNYLPKKFAGNAFDPANVTTGPLSMISGQGVKGLFGGLFTALLGGYNLVLIIINVALLPFIVFYLSVDFERLHAGALRILPGHLRKKVLSLANEIDIYLSAFIRGQLLVGTILCILYMAGLSFIGVELWFILALISGFGNLIPYLGFLVGILLSSIMALVTFGDLSHLLQVFVLYAIVQALEGTFITPKVVGNKVGLSPLAILLDIFAGGKLFGLLGVFLAIPATAVIRVLARSLHAWLLSRADLSPG